MIAVLLPASQARSAEERVVELEAQLAALTVERDTLRLAYRNAQQELELLFLAKAERLDTAQLELELVLEGRAERIDWDDRRLH